MAETQEEQEQLQGQEETQEEQEQLQGQEETQEDLQVDVELEAKALEVNWQAYSQFRTFAKKSDVAMELVKLVYGDPRLADEKTPEAVTEAYMLAYRGVNLVAAEHPGLLEQRGWWEEYAAYAGVDFDVEGDDDDEDDEEGDGDDEEGDGDGEE